MNIRKIDGGRYSIYFGKKWEWNDPVMRIEVSRKYNFGLGFRVQREERELQLSAYCFKLFSIYVTFETRRLKFLYQPVESGIRWDPAQGAVHVQLLDESSMDSSQPSVIDWYWNYVDWLFGRPVYSEAPHGREYQIKTEKIDMLEGVYTLKLDRYMAFWRRPRSPFTKKLERVEVTPTVPVGIPAKGESDYDQDEDATFSTTMPTRGRTNEQIAADFKEDIMKTRGQRSSRTWVPERDWSKSV